MAHAARPANDPSPRTAKPKRKQGFAGALAEIAIITVVAVALSVLTRTFLVQAFFVPSASMLDTLKIDDRILASKISTRLSGVNRGEIVVFRDPGGWLPPPVEPTGGGALVRNVLTFIGLLPSDSGQDLVKRVIGVGGDRVVCCDPAGKIVLNGVPLDESAYVRPGLGTDQVRFDVTVPEGRVFVMGDNRANSEDSRYHLTIDSGTVPVDNVVGRVVAIVWPASSWKGIGVPEVFADPRLTSRPAPRPSAAVPGGAPQ